MAKKSFENPASLFISAASDLREESPKAEKTQEKAEVTREELEQLLAAKGMKAVRAETRDRKIHLSVTPSLAEAIKAESEKTGLSRTELINRVLEREFLK